jgi:hypothetical protein
MTFKEKVNCRGEYNAKLLVILNQLIDKYPDLRLGQILYTFGFITKPVTSEDAYKLFDPFSEEPVDMYNRVVKTLEKYEVEL